MTDLGDIVRQENEALDAFIGSLAPEDWRRHTLFFNWTVADEIMHLHQVDLFGVQAMRNPDEFAATVKNVRALQAKGIELSAQMRESFGHLSPTQLRAQWRHTWEAMCDQFSADEPKRRVPWFGPSMSVRSFASARQMEVWAHGQDIFDLFARRRTNTDSIRNICELGVRTFGWSFENRREAVPPSAPRVSLNAPSGAQWVWNEQSEETVEGSAEDFALIVTQRRNVADTALRVEGAGARRWMQIAQCFAGPPETGPAPGVRDVRYEDR